MIKDINTTLKTLDGKEIYITQNVPSTFKSCFISMCELSKPEQSGDAIKAIAIGTKIYEAESDVDLSGEETSFLKDLVEKNVMGYPSIILAQLINKLTE